MADFGSDGRLEEALSIELRGWTFLENRGSSDLPPPSAHHGNASAYHSQPRPS